MHFLRGKRNTIVSATLNTIPSRFGSFLSLTSKRHLKCIICTHAFTSVHFKSWKVVRNYKCNTHIQRVKVLTKIDNQYLDLFNSTDPMSSIKRPGMVISLTLTWLMMANLVTSFLQEKTKGWMVWGYFLCEFNLCTVHSVLYPIKTLDRMMFFCISRQFSLKIQNLKRFFRSDEREDEVSCCFRESGSIVFRYISVL